MQQGGDLLRQAVQVVACQVELCGSGKRGERWWYGGEKDGKIINA